MKVIVTHEVDVAPDATVKEVRSLVLAASRSFVAALAPVGKALLAKVERRGGSRLIPEDRELEDVVLDAVRDVPGLQRRPR